MKACLNFVGKQNGLNVSMGCWTAEVPAQGHLRSGRLQLSESGGHNSRRSVCLVLDPFQGCRATSLSRGVKLVLMIEMEERKKRGKRKKGTGIPKIIWLPQSPRPWVWSTQSNFFFFFLVGCYAVRSMDTYLCTLCCCRLSPKLFFLFSSVPPSPS